MGWPLWELGPLLSQGQGCLAVGDTALPQKRCSAKANQWEAHWAVTGQSEGPQGVRLGTVAMPTRGQQGQTAATQAAGRSKEGGACTGANHTQLHPEHVLL